MKIEEKIEKYLNSNLDYFNEDNALQDIKELCEEFNIEYNIAEKIYLGEDIDSLVPYKNNDIANPASPKGKIVGLSTAGYIAGIGASAALWTIWRAISAFLDKAKKKCGTFSVSKDRDICILKAHIETLKKKIEIIKKAEAECLKINTSKAKIEECKYKAKKNIDILSNKIRDKEYEINKLKRG